MLARPGIFRQAAGVNSLFARRDTTTKLTISDRHVLAALMIVFCLVVPLGWAFLMVVRTIRVAKKGLPAGSAFESHPHS
jgi:hypothetical protein